MGSATKTLKLEDVKENVLDEYMMELIDEVTCGLCFEIHRSCKKGFFFLDESDAESLKQFQIVNKKGLDVFGQSPSNKKQIECSCPNCHRNLAASRFAPHLEKCMGMGRISSRIASRRIASSGNQCIKKESDRDSNDSDEDGDTIYRPDKKSKRSKKEKSKKRKKSKHSAENSPHSSISNTPTLSVNRDHDDDYLLDM